MTDPDEARAEPRAERPISYEIVYDCADDVVGARLAARLEQEVVVDGHVRDVEAGPTWAVAIAFPSPTAADRFFAGDRYQGFCRETRESCGSSVLVIPLGHV